MTNVGSMQEEACYQARKVYQGSANNRKRSSRKWSPGSDGNESTISSRSHRDLIAIRSTCVFIGGHGVEKEHTQQLHDDLSCWSCCGFRSEAVLDLCIFYTTVKDHLCYINSLGYIYKVVEHLHLHVFGMWKTSSYNWSWSGGTCNNWWALGNNKCKIMKKKEQNYKKLRSGKMTTTNPVKLSLSCRCWDAPD